MRSDRRPVWRGKISDVEHAIVSKGGDVLEAWPSHLGGSSPTMRSESQDQDPTVEAQGDAGLAFFVARAALWQVNAGLWEPSHPVEFGGVPWVVSTRESMVRCAYRGDVQVVASGYGVRVFRYRGSPDEADRAKDGRVYTARAALHGEADGVPPDLAADLLWRWRRGA